MKSNFICIISCCRNFIAEKFESNPPNKLLKLITFSPELNFDKINTIFSARILKREFDNDPTEVYNVACTSLPEEWTSIVDSGAVKYLCNAFIVLKNSIRLKQNCHMCELL